MAELVEANDLRPRQARASNPLAEYIEASVCPRQARASNPLAEYIEASVCPRQARASNPLVGYIEASDLRPRQARASGLLPVDRLRARNVPFPEPVEGNT